MDKRGNVIILSVFLAVFVIATSFLIYQTVERSKIIDFQNFELNKSAELITSLNSTLLSRDLKIGQLEVEISNLESDVQTKERQIEVQQETIFEKSKEVDKISKSVEEREKEIKRLKEVQRSLVNEGKLIVDEWENTLILYDNAEIYASQSGYMEVVKKDKINYAKIGIPFIYFKDESKQVEDGLILGTYSSLYNYIFIYKDNNNPRSIYHEIAHIIYFRLFADIDKNLEAWNDMYEFLKDNSLLSTEYSKANAVEGFAEEYSVYKTGIKAQPQFLKDFFKQVDDIVN
jgi:hypothetical protein